VQIVGLALTHSRAAWVGLAVAVLYLATFRYRRAWLVAGAAALVLVFAPQGNAVLARFLEAFGGQDRATALRLVEYHTATDLISQYPWFGVGFGAGPNVELFLGVSSLYLLIAEEMGLIGLAVFLALVGLLFARSLAGSGALHTPRAQGLALALQACLAAALTSGLFDHYFFRFPHSLALFWLYAALLWLATARPEAASAPAPEGVPPGVEARAGAGPPASRRPTDVPDVV
jgi:O-antigen ligase